MRVSLIDHMGSDLLVVNAARVSFKKYKKEFGDDDARLVSYLARNRHWTPFGHPHICLYVSAPIPIRTQCFKHKVGFVENEVSRRYVDDDPEYFYPIFRQKSDTAKQGSRDEFPVNLERVETLYSSIRDASDWVYKELLKEGVAPEQARFSLIQGAETEWYWTGSLAAYARFYTQRTDSHAQKEIQDLAIMAGDIIRPLFPVSWEALTKVTNE